MARTGRGRSGIRSVTACKRFVATAPAVLIAAVVCACGSVGDPIADLPTDEEPPTAPPPHATDEPLFAAAVGQAPTRWTVPDPLPAHSAEAIDAAASRARRSAIPVSPSAAAPRYLAWAPPDDVLTDDRVEALTAQAIWIEAGRPPDEAWTQSAVRWPGGVEAQWLQCPPGTAPSALLLVETATADLTDFPFDFPSVRAPLGMRYHAARISATTTDRSAGLELHDPQFYVHDFGEGDTVTVYVVDFAVPSVPRRVEVRLEVHGCE